MTDTIETSEYPVSSEQRHFFDLLSPGTGEPIFIPRLSASLGVNIYLTCNEGSSLFDIDRTILLDVFAQINGQFVLLGYCDRGYLDGIGYGDYNRHIQLETLSHLAHLAELNAGATVEAIYVYETVLVDTVAYRFRGRGVGSFMYAAAAYVLAVRGVSTFEMRSGLTPLSENMVARFGIIPQYSAYKISDLLQSTYTKRLFRDFIA
jgi:hypothetical protein